MKRLLRVLLLLVAGSLIAAEDKDAAKKELAKFQGTWIFESMVSDGEKVPPDSFKGSTLTIKDGIFTVKEGDTIYKGTFKVDPTKKPKEIDVIFTEGPDKGETMMGIYEIDGDTYRPCFAIGGKDRPKELASKKGSGIILQVLKKQKK